MNTLSALYVKHLVISGYRAALETANEVCARTQVNDPERNEALYNAANYGALVDDYGFQKEAGRSYFNVWD